MAGFIGQHGAAENGGLTELCKLVEEHSMRKKLMIDTYCQILIGQLAQNSSTSERRFDVYMRIRWEYLWVVN